VSRALSATVGASHPLLQTDATFDVAMFDRNSSLSLSLFSPFSLSLTLAQMLELTQDCQAIVKRVTTALNESATWSKHTNAWYVFVVVVVVVDIDKTLYLGV
jgi:hypothetical protein